MISLSVDAGSNEVFNIVHGMKTKAPLYQLIGGKCNEHIPVYGYGMMLQKKTVKELKVMAKGKIKGFSKNCG